MTETTTEVEETEEVAETEERPEYQGDGNIEVGMVFKINEAARPRWWIGREVEVVGQKRERFVVRFLDKTGITSQSRSAKEETWVAHESILGTLQADKLARDAEDLEDLEDEATLEPASDEDIEEIVDEGDLDGDSDELLADEDEDSDEDSDDSEE
jgi:hypothetical protein